MPGVSILLLATDDLAPFKPLEHSTRRTDLGWIDRLVSENPLAEPSVEYISPITTGLQELMSGAISTNDYSTIRNVLDGLNPSRMRSDVMIAVLRTLFPIRSYLTNTYVNAVRKVGDELSSRGRNVNRLLRGLH